MERHNRKSHLHFPQMSPASKALLRGGDPSTSSIAPSRDGQKRREKSSISGTAQSITPGSIPTPTTGEIPITRDPISATAANGKTSINRPSYPSRTSSASQVPQQINLPVRPAPQLGPVPARTSSRRPDTADRVLIDQQREQQQRDELQQQQVYASRRQGGASSHRQQYSDPRLGSSGSSSGGFPSVPGSREGFAAASSAAATGSRASTPGSADERAGVTPGARTFFDSR